MNRLIAVAVGAGGVFETCTVEEGAGLVDSGKAEAESGDFCGSTAFDTSVSAGAGLLFLDAINVPSVEFDGVLIEGTAGVEVRSVGVGGVGWLVAAAAMAPNLGSS